MGSNLSELVDSVTGNPCPLGQLSKVCIISDPSHSHISRFEFEERNKTTRNEIGRLSRYLCEHHSGAILDGCSAVDVAINELKSLKEEVAKLSYNTNIYRNDGQRLMFQIDDLKEQLNEKSKVYDIDDKNNTLVKVKTWIFLINRERVAIVAPSFYEACKKYVETVEFEAIWPENSEPPIESIARTIFAFPPASGRQAESVEAKSCEQEAPFKDCMEEARAIAARCWTDSETSHIQMDPTLAEAVAKRIARLIKDINALEKAYWIKLKEK